MSDYAYKPRHGYDIRVRPPGEEKKRVPRWAEAHTRVCDHPDCKEKAAVRVAKSPREINEKLWLCAAHAQQHNRAWNFFDGMSAKEAEAVRLAAIYGDRPTWEMGKNDRARAAARARGPADMRDSFGIFADVAKTQPRRDANIRDGRVVPKLQVQAFETLGLKVTAPSSEIRKRYAEMVRRFHPDANGGDRSAETQLQNVVRAHHILKKAGYC